MNKRICVVRVRSVAFVAVAASMFSVMAVAQATSNGAGQRNRVLTWDNAVLNAIKETSMGPPMAARALAIVHTCMYDAWAAYDQTAVGTQLGGKLRRPASERTPANKNTAIDFAAYRCSADLFPTKETEFAAVMTQAGENPADSSSDTSTATGIGNTSAAAVLAFRHNDGSNQLGDLHPGAYSDYTNYVAVNTPTQINNPDRWQPLVVPTATGSATQKFLGAQWGQVTGFALNPGSAVRPGAPYSYYQNRDAYVQQANELVNISAHLTDQQKMIAEYWADYSGTVTPPGHWCVFAQYISGRDHHNLDTDVKFFFVVSNAVFDAGIAAWDAKRAYDSVRPITAIHFLYSGTKLQAWGGPGKGTVTMDGSQWQPYQPLNVITPPFPEYFSGHSSFSAAAAAAMRLFTGSDNFGASVTLAPGTSFVELGTTPAAAVTLSWPTFTDAANEAGISRRYGGIHFALGDITGRRIGQQVGTMAFQKAQALFTGAQ